MTIRDCEIVQDFILKWICYGFHIALTSRLQARMGPGAEDITLDKTPIGVKCLPRFSSNTTYSNIYC